MNKVLILSEWIQKIEVFHKYSFYSSTETTSHKLTSVRNLEVKTERRKMEAGMSSIHYSIN